MGSAVPPDPLRAFLWGKRRAIRHPLALDVEVQGALDSVRALSLDVSASGALLRFQVAELVPEAADTVDPFLLAQTHFRGTPAARFRARRLKVHLELVRLDYRPQEPDFLYVGFRFPRPLSEKQLRKLGLDPTECGPEAHSLPSQHIDLRAAGDPPLCLVHGGGDPDQPPLECRYVGEGEGTVCLRAEGADLVEVGGRLRDGPVRLERYDGDRLDWKARARLQAIGLIHTPTEALELGFVLERKPRRRRA